MNKIIKLFLLVSLLGFLAILLLIYAALPPQVDVSLGSDIVQDVILSQNAFFYIVIAIVVLSNGVLMALSKVIKLVRNENQDDRQGSRATILSGNTFEKSLANWLGSFSVVLNIFYAMGIFFVGLYNNPEYALTGTYSILAYFSIFLIIAWIFWLVVIVLKKVGFKNA